MRTYVYGCATFALDLKYLFCIPSLGLRMGIPPYVRVFERECFRCRPQWLTVLLRWLTLRVTRKLVRVLPVVRRHISTML